MSAANSVAANWGVVYGPLLCGGFNVPIKGYLYVSYKITYWLSGERLQWYILLPFCLLLKCCYRYI